MHLYTDEGDIDTTANHPFYVMGKGWVAAGDLAIGDEVYNLDGSTSVVLASETEKLDGSVLVYNLEVEDLHSYFVGCVPVLVHNRCKFDTKQARQAAKKAGLNTPEQRGAFQREIEDLKRGEGKRNNDNYTFQELVDIALEVKKWFEK